MNKKRAIALVTVGALAMVVLLLVATSAWAGPNKRGLAAPLARATVVSDTISYQGRLLDNSGDPVDGTQTMDFRLYTDPSGGMPLWSQSSSVTVEDGLFNVNLTVDPAHFDGRALWLGVQVQGDAQEMTPRQPLLPVPYALSLRPGAAISGSISGVPALNILSGGIGLHVETTNSADPRDPALVGINHGAGPGVEGQSVNAFGVLGSSLNGPGVFGQSDIGTAGVFTSTYGYGVVIEGAGLDGLRIFDRVGLNYISAGADGGLDFRVTNTGTVYANGGYHCSLGPGAEPGTCVIQNSPADFAEMLPSGEGLEPGDVLVVGPDGRLARSTQAYQSAVVGVYSTQPGYLGGGEHRGQDGYAPRAVAGIVPVRASTEHGPIAPGDLLVSSATPGHAMKADPNPPLGTVIGKALQGLDAGTGVIQMLVTLQ